MCPLFNEKVTTGDGVVRTNEKSEYQRWLRECWSEELGRELTPAEIAARKRGQNLGKTAAPAHNDGNVTDLNFRIAGTRYVTKEQADLEDLRRREAAAHEREREKEGKEIAARQAAFLLEDELEQDQKYRLGL